MTKYIVYAFDEEHTSSSGENKYKVVKKFKKDYEAFYFVEDIKNLYRYGCMTVIKETDDGLRYVWNSDTTVWEQQNAMDDGSF